MLGTKIFGISMIKLYLYEPENESWRKGDFSLLPSVLAADNKLWIDLDQASPAEQLSVLQHFKIHPLLVEDFMRDRHPPKLEGSGNFSLLILRAFTHPELLSFSSSTQVHLLYSSQVLISKHIGDTELNQSLIKELTTGSQPSVTYWVKQQILAVAASYLNKLLEFENELSELEEVMLHRGNDEHMATMMRYRSVLRKLNRTLAYQKEIFSDAFYEDEHLLQQQFEKAQLRDFYEKFERLHSMTALYYDQLGDLLSGYLSASSHQINERMKVLTIVSTVFIPLTFIAGVYGMNFINMPELTHKNGYFFALGGMLLLGFGALFWFKLRRWW